MGLLVISLVLAGTEPDAEDPFANLINVLYNPHFVARDALLPESYGGSPPAPRNGIDEVRPGWMTEGAGRHTADEKVRFTPPVSLSLTDIETRLFDLSFDPNHPPELRWGAPEGSIERTDMPETYTPVPSGARVPRDQAYAWQAFYRSLGQRQTEMSCLRGMFTEGYPIMPKFNEYLAKWDDYTDPTPALEAWIVANNPPEPEPEPVRPRIGPIYVVPTADS